MLKFYFFSKKTFFFKEKRFIFALYKNEKTDLIDL